MNEYIKKMVTEMVKSQIAEIGKKAVSADDILFWDKFKGLKLINLCSADDLSLPERQRHNNVTGNFGADKFSFMKMEATFSFKAKKFEDNIVYYEIVLYTDGTASVYFDGTGYQA